MRCFLVFCCFPLALILWFGFLFFFFFGLLDNENSMLLMLFVTFELVGKNAYAMSILRRVEMKLDGQDIANNRYVRAMAFSPGILLLDLLIVFCPHSQRY